MRVCLPRKLNRSLAMSLSVVVFAQWGVACGDGGFLGGTNKFSGGGATQDELGKDLDGSAENPIDHYDLLLNAPCNGEEGSPVDSTITVEGFGDKQVERSMLAEEFILGIHGGLCIDDQKPRDIAFVVDVSDSMRGNFNGGHDPLLNGTCGRYDAARSVLSTLAKPDQGRASFVAFHNRVKRDSARLYSVADFQSRFLTVENFCLKEEALNTGTSYKAGLERARQLLLADSRRDAMKEIYFVSDGLPTRDGDGKTQADAAKGDGTFIATIMLNGDDSVLREKIASRDASGRPLHANVGNASGLADALRELARIRATDATLRLRPIGADDNAWQSQDLGDVYRKPAFELAIPITLAEFPNGFEYEIKYSDTRNQSHVISGSIAW